MEQLINARGIKTFVVTGEVSINNRASTLDNYRQTEEQAVAILSNVGERDLDIPEAELLIVFDLIRTIKTVYQKLKRSRGGECRILYYEGTKEEKKVKSVLNQIQKKYYWSTKIHPSESIDISPS